MYTYIYIYIHVYIQTSNPKAGRDHSDQRSDLAALCEPPSARDECRGPSRESARERATAGECVREAVLCRGAVLAAACSRRASRCETERAIYIEAENDIQTDSQTVRQRQAETDRETDTQKGGGGSGTERARKREREREREREMRCLMGHSLTFSPYLSHTPSLSLTVALSRSLTLSHSRTLSLQVGFRVAAPDAAGGKPRASALDLSRAHSLTLSHYLSRSRTHSL